MTNLDTILKTRDITFPAKVHLVKAMVFPVVMYGCGEGNGNPLRYSCLENPRDGGAWWAVVHGVAQSWTWLTDWTTATNKKSASSQGFMKTKFARLFKNYDWLCCIGEGNGNPLQCSCLENPRDGGAWWAVVCGVTQSLTRQKWLSSSSSWCKKGYICPQGLG